jgi:hypothetical protein
MSSESPLVQTQDSKTVPQVLGILLTCLAFGILADGLFRSDLLGINLSLFVTALAIGLYLWSKHLKQNSLNLWLLGLWVLLSWLFILRASPFLQTLNVAVQLFFMALLAAGLSVRAFKQSQFAEIAINILTTGLSLVFRPLVFLLEIPKADWGKYQDKQNAKVTLAVFRGLLIALPIFVVFTLLLASADAIFEGLLKNIFNFNAENIFEHGFIILLVSFAALALFSQTLFGSEWKPFDVSPPNLLHLGRIETSLIFGSLIVLFLSFIFIQFGSLFGGEARVLGTDITYAENGRRGFFELVAVTVLLHLLLLLGLWFITEAKARKLYQILATILVILLFGIIWSAQNRLGLYIETYGLTELRYYSSAMIYWIGVVMLYFLYRLYSDKAPRLAPSYIVLGLLGVIALYISNPDARIAGVNLERAKASREVDLEYLRQLSLDAVPMIAKYQATLPGLKDVLEDKYYTLPDRNWRQFNLGRYRGAERLKEMFQISL